MSTPERNQTKGRSKNTATAGRGGEVVRGVGIRLGAPGAGNSGRATPSLRFRLRTAWCSARSGLFPCADWPWRPWGISVCSGPLRRILASRGHAAVQAGGRFRLVPTMAPYPAFATASTAPTVAARAQCYQSSLLRPSRSRTPSSTRRFPPYSMMSRPARVSSRVALPSASDKSRSRRRVSGSSRSE